MELDEIDRNRFLKMLHEYVPYERTVPFTDGSLFVITNLCQEPAKKGVWLTLESKKWMKTRTHASIWIDAVNVIFRGEFLAAQQEIF